MENRKINISYTPSGEEQIKIFQEEQRLLLERIIQDDNYVLGDKDIEITGNDILKAKKRIVIIPGKKKSYAPKMISFTYIMLGILLTIGGLSYNYFRHIFEYNMIQAMVILMGVTIFFVGYFVLMYMKFRERKYNDFEKSTYREITNKVDEI